MERTADSPLAAPPTQSPPQPQLQSQLQLQSQSQSQPQSQSQSLGGTVLDSTRHKDTPPITTSTSNLHLHLQQQLLLQQPQEQNIRHQQPIQNVNLQQSPNSNSTSSPANNIHSSSSSLHENAPGTLSGFLWNLLSSTLADDEPYNNYSNNRPPSTSTPTPNLNPNGKENVIDREPSEPIHIEMVQTKHSLIDLAPSDPVPIRANRSHPNTASSDSAGGGIAASLFSLGRSLFGSSLDTDAPPIHTYSSTYDPPSSRGFGHLTTSTREERDSLLDLSQSARPIRLLKPNLPDSAATIMTESHAGLIRPNLPPLQREAASWRLVYSLDHHGISLNTLYNKCERDVGPQSPVVLLVRDGDGSIFGAFASESFHVQHGYFGNGSSFLFKLRKVEGPGESIEHEIAVYRATGANDYLILGESHFIAMGGGEGRFGLWIDAELYNGHSGPCQTFNNELLSSQPEFVVQNLEIWAFDI